MNSLKLCFVGIGSIASRHIKNLKIICRQREIELSIDAFRHSKTNTVDERFNHSYYCIENIPDDYDAIFITNPTEMHLESLKVFHNKGKHFFIEKPVVSYTQIEAARQFKRRKESIYYIACPLRYNAVIQYIKNNIHVEDVISVRSISSSYLPDWRPGQDYKKTYSAHRQLGGGVSIDLIHEWDYLTYLFGKPKQVFCLIGKKSPLEIDSDDYAIYIAELDNMIEELHLDYFGQSSIREIQLFMKNDTVVGDIVNNRITFLKTGNVIDFHEERNDFQRRELNYFLDMLLGVVPAVDGYSSGIDVLELTQGKLKEKS